MTCWDGDVIRFDHSSIHSFIHSFGGFFVRSSVCSVVFFLSRQARVGNAFSLFIYLSGFLRPFFGRAGLADDVDDDDDARVGNAVDLWEFLW